MYLTIILLPLLSGLINGLIGRKIGKSGSEWIIKLGITLSTILGLIGYYEIIIRNSGVIIDMINIFETEIIDITWNIGIDSLTISIFIPILIVSMCVQYYSLDYMKEDPHSIRFNSIISLFTFFMLVLISGTNWFIIYLGWEGVGICSYLLINHWFKRNKANKAAIKAIIINRIGDWSLTIGIILISIITGNIEINTMNSLGSYISSDILLILTIFILIGAMAKSSQIGLHTWLPTSMEGPTPVSSMLHAATLVVAGLYILIRISPILEYSRETLIIITWLGSITTVVAGLIGILQKDVKRIIAYSTMSQLGYMMIAIGISEYELSIYHIVNHAYYKALLFMSMGVIIHTINDEQDIRRLGGVIRKLPYTYICIIIGSLSLMGIPYMSGNYSKEMIIELTYNHYKLETYISYILGIISVLFTSIYSIKIIKYALINIPGSRKVITGKIEDPNINMYLPMFILSILSIINGYLIKDVTIGIGNNIYGNSVPAMPGIEYGNSLISKIKRIETIGTDKDLIDSVEVSSINEILEIIIKNIPMIIIILIILINLIRKRILSNLITQVKKIKRIVEFIIKGMEIDNIYNNIVIKWIYNLGKIIGKRIDKGLLEILIAFKMIEKLKEKSIIMAALDNGNIYKLIINILFGIILLDNINTIELIIILITGLVSNKIK